MNELFDQDCARGRDLALLIDEKEAASGFEPEMMDLQSTALPLGYAALVIDVERSRESVPSDCRTSGRRNGLWNGRINLVLN